MLDQKFNDSSVVSEDVSLPSLDFRQNLCVEILNRIAHLPS